MEIMSKDRIRSHGEGTAKKMANLQNGHLVAWWDDFGIGRRQHALVSRRQRP